MSRSSRFPNLREFRARAARLGQSGGRPAEASAEPPAGGAPAPSPMVWAWAAMGLAAAGLIGWTLLGDAGPDAVPAGTGQAAAPMARGGAAPLPPPEVTGAVPAPAPADRSVAQALGRIDRRLDGLGRAQAALEGRQATLEGRVAVIENAFGPASGAIDGTAAPGSVPAAAGKSDAPPASLLPPALGRSAAREVPAAPPAGSEIRFGIDLGGFVDLQSLAEAWQLLHAKYRRTLGDLTPLQVTKLLPDGTASYHLIAGPFDDIAAAGEVCAELKAQGTPCSRSVHVGAPL